MENPEIKQLNGYKLLSNSGKLSQSTYLYSGYYITTPSENFYLVMQHDGNLILYADSGFTVTVWSTLSNNDKKVDRYALFISESSQLEIFEESNPGKDVTWYSSNRKHVGMKNGELVLNENGDFYLADLDKQEIVWRSTNDNYTEDVGNFIDCNLPRNTIYQEQYLKSEDGKYFLKMSKDGNLVLYQDSIQSQNVKWISNTAHLGEQPYSAVIQKQGNITIYDKYNSSIWSTETANQDSGKYRFELQNNGNLVIYDSEDKQKIIWKRDNSD